MNMIDFLKALLLRNTDSKAPENQSRKSKVNYWTVQNHFQESSRLGLLSPFRMDGWVIELISFKLLTKGRDIRSASNVVRNTISDGGSYVAKSLAGNTFSKGAGKVGVWRGF